MSNEVRTLSPVTFFGGKDSDPFGMTNFGPEYHDPDAPTLPLDVAEPTAEELAKVEELAQRAAGEDPEAGITKGADEQEVLPLGIGDGKPGDEPADEPKRSGKVPPA